jgi:hypothetical protein
VSIQPYSLERACRLASSIPGVVLASQLPGADQAAADCPSGAPPTAPDARPADSTTPEPRRKKLPADYLT